MTNRETMQMLLAGEQPRTTPQWLMAFASGELMNRLMPPGSRYPGYAIYPDQSAYPFTAMGEALLRGEQAFNAHIDRVGFPVGWGSNAAFGHGGPGEFGACVTERHEEYCIIEFETGARKEIRFHPHNQRMLSLPVENLDDLNRLRLPDPSDPARYVGFGEDVAWAKAHGEWTIGWVNGFFSGVHYYLREYAEFFMDLAGEPAFAKAMIDVVGAWNIAAARMMCAAGVDCIGFCDDLGSEHAMLIGPAMYREYFWPWHKELCDVAHEHGAVVHMHSHGAILPVVPLLAEAGVDILNPLDPDDGMPMPDVRAAAGKRMVLCGGMDKHFWDWSADRQAQYLKLVIADGRRLGPHILMDSGGIPDNVTRENFDRFLAMSAEIRRQ